MGRQQGGPPQGARPRRSIAPPGSPGPEASARPCRWSQIGQAGDDDVEAAETALAHDGILRARPARPPRPVPRRVRLPLQPDGRAAAPDRARPAACSGTAPSSVEHLRAHPPRRPADRHPARVRDRRLGARVDRHVQAAAPARRRGSSAPYELRVFNKIGDPRPRRHRPLHPRGARATRRRRPRGSTTSRWPARWPRRSPPRR